MNIGTITATLAFAVGVSDAVVQSALQPFLDVDDDGEWKLHDSLADEFSALCDLSLQSLMGERDRRLRTLRVEVGYGGPDYRRGCLDLGAELMVDAVEMADAQEFLQNTDVATGFERQLITATGRFRADHLLLSCLDEANASFYLPEDPIWDS